MRLLSTHDIHLYLDVEFVRCFCCHSTKIRNFIDENTHQTYYALSLLCAHLAASTATTATTIPAKSLATFSFSCRCGALFWTD